jgi:predicted amidophosphoribosyltransferase
MGLLTSKIKCGNAYFTHLYLRPYLPLSAGADALSLSLVKFKQRIQPDLNTWIEDAAQLLSRLSFSPDTIIIRALRHDETCARPEFPSALDLLGQSLATSFHCRYIPTLVSKSRVTLPNKHLTRRERRSQLRDVYHVATASLSPLTPFLLIDDILTTGATMRALISAICCVYPDCPIHAFTLTRADYAWPIDPGTNAVKSGPPNASERDHALPPAPSAPDHALPSTPSEPEMRLPPIPQTRTMR